MSGAPGKGRRTGGGGRAGSGDPMIAIRLGIAVRATPAGVPAVTDEVSP